MNKRIAKKIRKRKGYFHYKDYYKFMECLQDSIGKPFDQLILYANLRNKNRRKYPLLAVVDSLKKLKVEKIISGDNFSSVFPPITEYVKFLPNEAIKTFHAHQKLQTVYEQHHPESSEAEIPTNDDNRQLPDIVRPIYFLPKTQDTPVNKGWKLSQDESTKLNGDKIELRVGSTDVRSYFMKSSASKRTQILPQFRQEVLDHWSDMEKGAVCDYYYLSRPFRSLPIINPKTGNIFSSGSMPVAMEKAMYELTSMSANTEYGIPCPPFSPL